LGLAVFIGQIKCLGIGFGGIMVALAYLCHPEVGAN
jgi:hypothetical protein